MRAIQLVEVPNQAAFYIRDAAKYLGISPNILRKKADLGLVRCGYDENGYRVFLLEDLDAYRLSLLKNTPREEYNLHSPTRPPKERRRVMSVKLEKDWRGRKRYRVSRYWPDGTRFRRFMPNRRKALDVDARIHAAICDGSWMRLKARLERGQGRPMTVAHYALIYRDEYCRPRNKSWKRKWSSMKVINQILGKVQLRNLRPVHLHQFVRLRKAAGIDNGTINRDLTTLKHMVKHAKQTEVIRRNRIREFPKLRETIKARPRATLADIDRLVSHLPYELQQVMTFMRETGCRLQEALSLKHNQVRPDQRLVVFTDNTKSGRFRLVPLTDKALEAIQSYPILPQCPYVFWRPKTKTRFRSIYRPFYKAREAAGMEWLQMKDLRQYFAIDLAESGADMKDIQKVLGHSSVRTTEQYYAKYSPHSAARRVFILLQEREQSRTKTGKNEVHQQIEVGK